MNFFFGLQFCLPMKAELLTTIQWPIQTFQTSILFFAIVVKSFKDGISDIPSRFYDSWDCAPGNFTEPIHPARLKRYYLDNYLIPAYKHRWHWHLCLTVRNCMDVKTFRWSAAGCAPANNPANWGGTGRKSVSLSSLSGCNLPSNHTWKNRPCRLPGSLFS